MRLIWEFTDIYIFNDKRHVESPYLGTGYNQFLDKIFITKNVFPDEKSFSMHPRDRLSVRAVLAHEYYGHRQFRDEYLKDAETGIITTPQWEDECRASINAALYAPNLTSQERALLLDDALFRAHEYGQELDIHSANNEELRKLYESLYGNHNDIKYIVPPLSKTSPVYTPIEEFSFIEALKEANPQLKEQEIQLALGNNNIEERASEAVRRVESIKEDIVNTISDQRDRIEHSFEIREAMEQERITHSHNHGMSL